MRKNMAKLNLGCGKDYRQGWFNVDCRRDLKTDFVHNLNKFPYPFKDNFFSKADLKMILEHLRNPIKVLKEMQRICKNNALVKVIVPHANSYANKTDLQHKTNFTENSFSPELLDEYGLKQLKLVKKDFLFPTNKWKKIIPFKKYFKIFFNGIYDDLFFEFKVVK